MAGINTRALNHPRVLLALRAISITIRHTPAPSDPVTPAVLRQALANINSAHSPEATHLAILLMYMGFLRQSSVAPQSVPTFDRTRHLTCDDISTSALGLLVHLKWTKTLQTSADATDLLLPPTSDPVLCPLSAMTRYEMATPRPASAGAPLLRHRDGNTLTVPFIRRQWNKLLETAGLNGARYTLHGLRRGAAQFTYNEARADLNDVMTHGTWRSQAVRSYIRPAQNTNNSVYRALQRL